VGGNGVVEGNITGKQADILGKISGNIKVSDLLKLGGGCIVNGNVYAGKLHIEPAATFNGECHMGANIVEMKEQNETQVAAAK
jgi:cytoskeletal protein CcmA (bactofilin family)